MDDRNLICSYENYMETLYVNQYENFNIYFI